MGYEIVLKFDSAAETMLALEYIGDKDAPILLSPTTSSTVTIDGFGAYSLWAGYESIMKRLLIEARAETPQSGR